MTNNRFAISKTITASDIKNLRRKLGLTQSEFADLSNVTKNTIEKLESKDGDIKGTIVSFVKLLELNPELVEKIRVPNKTSQIRIWYMYKSSVCSIIDVFEREKKIIVSNYVEDDIYKAFGKIKAPTYEDYEEFLEERCFPRSRDKMKLVLHDLNIPFYDPLLIIEKTEGRMAEDNFWIKIEK